MVAAAPKESLSLIRGLDDRAVPWTGLVIGIPILCAYFWLTNQNMVQWVLSAKSKRDARRGLLFAGVLKLPILFLIVIPGVAAISLIPDLTEPDRIYPAMLLTLLPTGVLGIVLAGFVAAIMSHTDSTLHAASTIVTMDFIHEWKPNITSRQLVRIGRVTTILIIGVSAIWAPMIGNFGTLFEYVQGVLSYAVAPFVVVYLGGIFWSRATATGAIAAIISGLMTAIMIGILGDGLNVIDIHYLHVPLPVTVVSMFTLYGVSKMTSQARIEPRLLWSKARVISNPFRKDRIAAMCLLGLTLILVTLFH